MVVENRGSKPDICPTRELRVTDLVKQKADAEKLLELPVEGCTWYVLDHRWWTKWNAFMDAVLDGDSLEVACDDYPGEIDNTNLLIDGKLKPDLLREEDLTVIPEEVWKLFVDYYGCVHKDSTVFQRTAVQAPGKWVVEIYPPCFAFRHLNTEKLGFEGTYSESQTIGELKSIIKKELKLSGCVHLFVRDGEVAEELTNDDVTIGEASLERNQTLYFRVDAEVDRIKPGSTGYTGAGSSQLNGAVSTTPFGSSLPSSLHQPGICGLSNLGNTCFMNSAIQCMSNVPELTAYFLSLKWKKELNYNNPLGARGRIATAYAELIDHMWSGSYAYDVPRTLKREIALIANQFYGYAQHDSHELLVFLLDGLHEDLNRVLKKPYVEFKDAGDRPDPVVADEAWNNHKTRNDSVIVDYFHGQIKSIVVCPTCKFRSVTFDPIASLNLPLPESNRYYKPVFMWPWNRIGRGAGPVRYEVAVPAVFYVRDVISSLEQLRPAEKHCQYYLSEVYNHSLNQPYHATHQIRDRFGPPLFAYELPEGELIPVRLHQLNCYNTSGWVGIPFYISIPPDLQTQLTQTDLIHTVAARLSAIGIHSVESGESDWLFDLDGGPAVSGNTQDPNQASPMDQDEQEPSGLVDFLQSRIQLTDDYNRPAVDLSKETTFDLNRLALTHFRLSVDCTDSSSLQTRLDNLMRSITRMQKTQPFQTVKTSTPAISLSECVEKFVSIEKLSATDLWYCRRCKEQKQATKKFDLWSLPKILVIQLKRFRSTLRSSDKIDNLVEFPVRGLDLTRWVVNDSNDPCIYDLIAVSNHMGYLGGGHYTAFALNARTQRWYIFDDASTREIHESKVVTNAAYMLIYHRREADGTTARSVPSNQPNSTGARQPTCMYINDDDLTNVE